MMMMKVMMMIINMIMMAMMMAMMMTAIYIQVIVAANRVYHDFLASEDGSGFSGQVTIPPAFYQNQVNLGSDPCHVDLLFGFLLFIFSLSFPLPFQENRG